jgi:hypothetical protein
LIEFAQPGVPENLSALGAILNWNCPRDAIVVINPVDHQFVQLAVALPEFPLSRDGLALTLFLGADAQVNRNGHQASFFASTT